MSSHIGVACSSARNKVLNSFGVLLACWSLEVSSCVHPKKENGGCRAYSHVAEGRDEIACSAEVLIAEKLHQTMSSQLPLCLWGGSSKFYAAPSRISVHFCIHSPPPAHSQNID